MAVREEDMTTYYKHHIGTLFKREIELMDYCANVERWYIYIDGTGWSLNGGPYGNLQSKDWAELSTEEVEKELFLRGL
jgi:hypothetical protein